MGLLMKKECQHCFSVLPENFFIACKYCGALICWGCERDHACTVPKKVVKYSKYGFELGIVSYNTGSPQYKNGVLRNADYLKKVLKYAKGWADG